MERQPVGTCKTCGEIVYCDGGFLQGIVQADHSIKCYECLEKDEEVRDPGE